MSEYAIRITEDEYWIRIGETKHANSFKGKYLFFSKNQDLLIKIATAEIKNNGFEIAKVSAKPNNEEYVLCLYWTDDKRKYELANKHIDNLNMRYRYWKSNQDTRKGIYSKKE